MLDLTIPGAKTLLAERITEGVEQATASPAKYSYRLKPSNLGDDCPAKLWFAFRWVAKKAITGQQQRTFDRGNASEDRMAAYLRKAGWTVVQEDPAKAHRDSFRQFSVKALDGHVSAYLDALVSHPEHTSGLVGLGEFKTMNRKKFNLLVSKKSIQLTNYYYYVQHVVYLAAMGLDFGIIFVECTDTQELYIEVITRDDATAQRAYDLAVTIKEAQYRPARIAESSTFHKCNGCEFNGVCHLNEKPDKNCRSCMFAKAGPDGGFVCDRYGPIPNDAMKVGCNDWVPIINA